MDKRFESIGIFEQLKGKSKLADGEYEYQRGRLDGSRAAIEAGFQAGYYTALKHVFEIFERPENADEMLKKIDDVIKNMEEGIEK